MIITYVWNVKQDTNEPVYEAETDSWTPGLWLLRGAGGKDRLGVWHQQMQTLTYRLHKPQDPTLQHRNYIQYPEISHNGEDYKKEYVCITELLFCSAEINGVNQLYFNFLKSDEYFLKS